ncbi:MAG: hypothetical protein KAJ19_08705 [Gammaproteobacteria bacterium]|nr:hypothetical protein [Gammaproteobacteria bacterium]
MKKFPVEVWDVVDKEDGLGPQRTLLHDRAPDHVEAEDAEAARDKVVAKLAKADVELTAVQIDICTPLAR